jgi:RNA polymerase sigma-70 factor (ECF subfamily)
MDDPQPSLFLSQIATEWTLIFRAQQQGDEADTARHELLLRYHKAVYRLLERKLGHPLAAGALCSDFAVRVLECDYFLRKADQKRGRFRDYLRTVLNHWIADYYRKHRQLKDRERPLPAHVEPVAASATSSSPLQSVAGAAIEGRGGTAPETFGEDDPDFLAAWKYELETQAFQALEEVERRTGQPYATLVRLKQAAPSPTARQLVEQLGSRLGKPFTPFYIRMLVHRGREQYADLLIAEVARTLRTLPDDYVAPDQLQEELLRLRLFTYYVKRAWERYARKYRPAAGAA